MMNKRVTLLMSIVLIAGVFAPIISVASAGKPDKVPPPLEKRVFIHYRKGFGRPPWAGGGKPKEDSGQYKLLGKGVEWKNTPVTYVIDPDNPDGLTEQFIVDAIFASAEEWDANTETELFDETYAIDHDSSWDDESPDGNNELLFGDYPQEGVIAVTIIWGYFSGPPPLREIIEFDIMFDTDYTWGYAGETSETELGEMIMDLQNIATHELGHGAGLADLYDSSASDETMYGYSEYGETKKRTLYKGDIAGIQELYG